MADLRRLVLVRHAKAVSESAGGDRSRSLADRGRRDSGRAGGWLAEHVGTPDAVWCSSAVRAQETWTAMAAGLAGAPEPVSRDDLYDAGPEDLIEIVGGAPDDVRTLVVVGHNPTMERASAWLTGDDRNFPTCAVAVVLLPGPWSDVAPGAGRLADFFVPH